MNNKAYLGAENPAGWAIGWARVAKSGEAEMEAHLTHFEKNQPHEKWLMVFRTQQEAKSYIVANLPADVLGGCKWACVEFTASDLLGFLRDYPDVEGVLFNPDSDEAHFVPAAVLIGASGKALDKPESDAA